MDPKHSHGPDRIDYQELPGDLTEVHASIQREHPEPTAETTPVPMWLIAVCGFAVLWAGIYMGVFNGGLKGDVFNELNATASLLFPVEIKGKGGPSGPVAELPLVEQGKIVYQNCQTCHQPNGLGAPNQFPPLVKSDFVLGSEKRMIAILLKGLTGPITVNGATFNGAMPPWETLSNKKIAAVASYVRSAWGNNAPEINEAQVAAARTEFSKQAGSWTVDQILQIPADATLPGGGAAAAPADGAAPAGAAAAAPAAAPAGAPAAAVVANATPAAAPAAGGAVDTAQMEDGKKTYMTTCIACHMPTGVGLFPVFPPLVKSPYVAGSPERMIAMVLKGQLPPFNLDGKTYSGVMVPQEATLTDDKIASVITYVRNSFGNSASPVSTEMVAAARKKFADRKTPWTQPEIDAWKD